MTQREEMLEQAIEHYHHLGLTVLPINGDKQPNLDSWKQYQTEQPEWAVVQKWIDENRFDNNMAIVTGGNKNVVAIDIDDKNVLGKIKLDFKKMCKKGYWIEETKKGYHIFARMENLPKPRKDKPIEFFSTGNYVIISPSENKKMLNGDKIIDLQLPVFDNDFYNKYCEMRDILGDGKSFKTIQQVSLKGTIEGERDNSLFLTACKLRDAGVKRGDTLTFLIEKNKNSDPPLPKKEVIKCLNSAYNYLNKVEDVKPIDLTKAPKNRTELYAHLRKWLYIPYTDRIDITMATAISNKSEDKPLWTFEYAPSGDAKSEILSGLEGLPNVLMIDKITPHTLSSGKKEKGKKVPDLGQQLENKHTILVIKDLACLQTLKPDDKRQVWGQFRELYDGDVNSRTGNNVICRYRNCYVTIIAGGVPSFRNEQIIKDQLGTREIQYLCYSKSEDNKRKVEKALSHRNKEKQMKKEISSAIHGFLATHKFNPEIETPDHIITYIEEQANNLALLRADASIDWRTGELFGDVTPEIPTRFVQQLDLLYRCLKCYDKDYPDENFKRIVKNIIKTSSVKMRYDVIKYFVRKKKEDNEIFWYKLNEIAKEMNKARTSIKAQCNILCELGFLEQDQEDTLLENTDRYITIHRYKLKGSVILQSTFDEYL